MAALSALDLLYAGIGFTVFVAGFLAGCALFLFAQPGDDPFSDAAYGDSPFMSADDLKVLHGTQNITGGQPNHVQH